MATKSLFKNSIYKSLLNLANIIVPIFMGPYIARLLDVNLYGIYNKVYAEFQIFLIFAGFGLYNYGIREFSKVRDDPKKISKLFSSLFVVGILSNIITLIVYVIYSFATSDGITTVVYMIMTIQIVGNIFYIEFVNEALENYKFITIKTLIIKVFYVLGLIVFVRKPEDIVPYAVVINLTVFANNIVSFIYAKKRIKFDFKEIKIVKYIKPLVLVLLISNVEILYSQLDKVMLGKFVDDVAVTMYYIPYYIIATLASFPLSIISVAIPRASYMLHEHGKEAYENTLEKAASASLFIMIPMCLGVCVLAPEIMQIYGGAKYVVATTTLMFACIHRLIITAESILTNLVMYTNNKEKQLVRMMFGFGVLNIILNSLLVVFKVFTPITEMITTAIAEFLLVTTQMLYSIKVLHIKPRIFTKQNLLYLALGVLFIPISLGVRFLKLGMIMNILVIMLLCAGLYVIVLLIKKDYNLFLILEKVTNRIPFIHITAGQDKEDK